MGSNRSQYQQHYQTANAVRRVGQEDELNVMAQKVIASSSSNFAGSNSDSLAPFASNMSSFKLDKRQEAAMLEQPVVPTTGGGGGRGSSHSYGSQQREPMQQQQHIDPSAASKHPPALVRQFNGTQMVRPDKQQANKQSEFNVSSSDPNASANGHQFKPQTAASALQGVREIHFGAKVAL